MSSNIYEKIGECTTSKLYKLALNKLLQNVSEKYILLIGNIFSIIFELLASIETKVNFINHLNHHLLTYLLLIIV